MQEVLHANIFFFITSVSVVLVSVALLFILWEVWKLSKILHRLAKKIEREADAYVDASEHLREKLMDYPLVEWLMGRKNRQARGSKREHN